ncbi:uncharacterized protein OCT59_015220 [Rhizophagus irregularis]|uniref:uncharacterized protein n=1 Tax=Rhizophagus irregularis TaxID=588596 RepID=UPI00331BEFD2|nr:hypothetical protein OCT59_015220 [Rhizophagus irregularis]
MEQNYISDNIFKQIKDFNFRILTEEQELIINKLILKEELKECYKKYGLCDECKQPNTEFLDEIKTHLRMNNSECIIKVYGITKDPKTNNFMMVLEHATDGNLRQRLSKYFDSFSWREKIGMLRDIAFGLNEIHEEELIHQDFHSGNILNSLRDSTTNITDLGLCKPANNKSENYEIYGVLPYVAPEVLREKKYIQASNVYSFGIIIYEVFNILPPYHDIAHDESLAIKICQGQRPGFNIKVPQLIEDITKQCVDADSLKRPTTKYLKEIFDQWYDLVYYKKDSEICKQINEADVFNEKLPSFAKSENFTYTIHPQAIYTSRLLNFDNLSEPKNAD